MCTAHTWAFLEEVAGDAEQVAIGIDRRPSSPEIAAHCADAVRAIGRAVVWCGVLPTLALYARAQGVPAIMVTGSHIPFDRNAIKFYRLDGEITKADEVAITAALGRCAGPVPAGDGLPAEDGAARDGYVRRYLDFFGSGALAGLHVGLYEHSSASREVLRAILEGLGARVTGLGRTDAFVPVDTEAARREGIGAVVGFETNGGFLLGFDVERAGRRLAALPTRDAALPALAVLGAVVTSI